MRVHKVLESIFGSPAKIHILRVLLNSPQPLSGRQVGELSGFTHKGAIHALKSLVDLGAVQQRRVGKAYQYSLSKNSIFVEKIITPCIMAEASLFDDLKREITAHFSNDTISLVLYGSVARGEEKDGSDIDVLAIVKDETKKRKVEDKTASKVPYFNARFKGLLSLHCFILKEIKGKKTLFMLRSAMREGIRLSGKPLEELLR